MDENNVNTNTNDATGESGSKQSLGSKLSSGISKANQLRQDYQNGGLTGVAKNAINNKIHDKIGSKVDAAKAKAKDKIDDKKDALKGKINDKLPDSVKQKKAQMDAKKKAIQDKVNAPKNKAAGVKNQLDNKRKKINETAFKKTAKTVADSVAPGSGLAAEKLLDSKIGKPAVEAARNASNPISAIKEGTKKLVEIIVKNKINKNGTDKSLYVFEAPIDLLSHITLYPYGWQEHSYVACCGTSIQPVLERLRQNPKLDMVYLCLDNDDAGNDACDRMTDTLEDMGLDVERLCPVRKDWNDDLCAKFERKGKDA